MKEKITGYLRQQALERSLEVGLCLNEGAVLGCCGWNMLKEENVRCEVRIVRSSDSSMYAAVGETLYFIFKEVKKCLGRRVT